MVIKSQNLEMDDQKKEVTFKGAVHATREDFEIECEEMLVRYDDAPKGGEADMAGARIKEIVATGNVVIRRAQGGVATAGKAVFFQREDKVVLTGSPVVRQGKDLVEGNKITIFLKENRSVVEGSKDSRVRAVIFPREKEK
jgi:lipopolysaccharide export system protein LptA